MIMFCFFMFALALMPYVVLSGSDPVIEKRACDGYTGIDAYFMQCLYIKESPQRPRAHRFVQQNDPVYFYKPHKDQSPDNADVWRRYVWSQTTDEKNYLHFFPTKRGDKNIIFKDKKDFVDELLKGNVANEDEEIPLFGKIKHFPKLFKFECGSHYMHQSIESTELNKIFHFQGFPGAHVAVDDGHISLVQGCIFRFKDSGSGARSKYHSVEFTGFEDVERKWYQKKNVKTGIRLNFKEIKGNYVEGYIRVFIDEFKEKLYPKLEIAENAVVKARSIGYNEYVYDDEFYDEIYEEEEKLERLLRLMRHKKEYDGY